MHPPWYAKPPWALSLSLLSFKAMKT
jgi:hypothetical protein